MAMTNMEWIMLARSGGRDPNVQPATTTSADAKKAIELKSDGSAPSATENATDEMIQKRLIFVVDQYASLFQNQGATKPQEKIIWTLDFTITADGNELPGSGQLPVTENGRCAPAPVAIPQEGGMIDVKMTSSKGLSVGGYCSIEPYDGRVVFIKVEPKTADITVSAARAATEGVNGPTRSKTEDSTAEIGGGVGITGKYVSKEGVTIGDQNKTSSTQNTTTTQTTQKSVIGLICTASKAAPTGTADLGSRGGISAA